MGELSLAKAYSRCRTGHFIGCVTEEIEFQKRVSKGDALACENDSQLRSLNLWTQETTIN